MPRKKAEVVNTEEITEVSEETTKGDTINSIDDNATLVKTTIKARVKPKDDESEIDTNMNVYQKLSYIRNDIRKPSKTFYNTKNKFYFFSATDIRESVKDICEKLGVIIISNVSKEGDNTCVTSDFVDMISGNSISFTAYANLRDKALEPEERTLAETEFALRISLANMFHFNMFSNEGKIVFSDKMDEKSEKTKEVKNELLTEHTDDSPCILKQSEEETSKCAVPDKETTEVEPEREVSEKVMDDNTAPMQETIGENLINATPVNKPEPEKVELKPTVKRVIRPLRRS